MSGVFSKTTPFMKSNLSSHAAAYLSLGVGILALGFSAIFVRWANAPGSVVGFYRMAVAVVLLAWPFYRATKANGRLPSAGVWMAILGGAFFAADIATWATGVRLGGATNPTLLANTAPVWVGLGALAFFREKLSAWFWAGLALALVGAAVVLGVNRTQPADFNTGSLLGLLAGVFYAGYFLFTQRGRETLGSLTFFWISAFSSMAFCLAAALIFGDPLTGYSNFTYMNFIALGVVTQGAGYLAISYALGHLPASIVSSSLLGQPVATALLAGPLLGETFSGLQILGGLGVLAGVFVVHRKGVAHPTQTEQIRSNP